MNSHTREPTTRQTLRVLQSPAVQVVSLEGQGSQPEAKARIFWDHSRRAWLFHAAGLKPSDPGRTYELWFITADDRKISAGTFEVDANDEGSLRALVPEVS